jgi:hypothetical protein
VLLRDTEAENGGETAPRFYLLLGGESAGLAALLARVSIGSLARDGGVNKAPSNRRDWQQASHEKRSEQADARAQ